MNDSIQKDIKYDKQITELTIELLTLLDLIEVQEDSTLARQRFEILKNYGYKVQFSSLSTGTLQ